MDFSRGGPAIPNFAYKTKIGLVGGNREGLELLALLLGDPQTEVKILIDPSPSALLFRFKEYGFDLIEEGRCQLSQRVEDLSSFNDLNVVIDLQGDSSLHAEILKAAPSGSFVVDGKTAALLWGLRLSRLKQDQREFQRLLQDPTFFASRVKPVMDALDLVHRPLDFYRLFLDLLLLATGGEQARFIFEKPYGMHPLYHPQKVQTAVEKEVSTSLGIPMHSDSELLGYIWIEKSFKHAPFTDYDLKFISKIISYVLVYTKKTVQLAEMKYLLRIENLRKQIQKVLSTESGGITAKLEQILSALSSSLGLAHIDLYLRDNHTQEWILQSSTGPGKQVIGQIQADKDKGIFRSVLDVQEGLFLYSNHPSYPSSWQEGYFPLKVGNRPVGILFFQREPSSPNVEMGERIIEEVIHSLGEQIEQEMIRQQSAQTLLKLSTLNEKGLELIGLENVDQVISAATAFAALLIKVQVVVLRLHEQGEWWVGGSYGVEEGPKSEVVFALDESLVNERVIPSGAPLLLNDLKREEDLPEGIPYKSMISVPIKHGDQWVAVLSLYNKQCSLPFEIPIFTKEDLEILNKYGGYLSKALFQTKNVESMENMPGTDLETGLKNESYFLTRLVEELERAARYDRKLGLVVLEIDRYKELSPRLDGNAVKEMVQKVGQIISETFRNVDVVARLSESRFGVILPDTGNNLMEGISRFGKNITRCKFRIGEMEPVILKFLIGWSHFPNMATTPEELLSIASKLNPLHIVPSDT